MRPGGVNGSGILRPKLQIAAEGVAPSMWLRGSRRRDVLADVDPHRVRLPRESRNDSEPLIGSRAVIRV